MNMKFSKLNVWLNKKSHSLEWLPTELLLVLITNLSDVL